MPFWKKTDKGGKKKSPKSAVPRTAQQSIPMQRMFEDGTCRVRANYYTRTIAYQDINYQLAQQEDKNAIFEEWCSFLNFFDSSIKFELSFVNMATDSSEFEKSIRIPFQKDGFDDVRAEYSLMLRQQLAKGNNGLTKTKFITFGVEGESMRQVKTRLDHVQNDLLNNFHRLGVQAKPLNGTERLKLMHDMYNHYVRDGFGKLRISKIKYSDIKKFYYSLILEKGFKPNSMEIVHTLLHPTFTMAVRDGLLRLNPTEGVMAEIKKSHCWEKTKRHALTVAEQRAFTNYIANSEEYRGWFPLFTVMLGTGCRIGEVLGLRWQDVDFKNRTISINHNLVYRVQEDGTCTNHVNSPKTKAGIRIIPMIDEVFDAFLEEYQYQKVIGFCTDEIDGYSGFVFCTGDGKVYLPNAINRTIRSICADYNKEEESKAKEENRDPVLLPKFSCHILRHTFCTRFCENETNLKVIQEIMGHADISTTMDVYAEATQEKKKESMTSLQSALLVR